MRDFATNPRTMREALALIAENAKSGQMVRGAYRRHNKTCSIGCLFTEEQLSWIKARRANQYHVSALVKEIGLKNFKAMTGMGVDDANAIQQLNDGAAHGNAVAVHQAVLSVLINGKGRINGREFKLS